ncbi:PadR family transcriptional regulator [Edaphobacter acidisoli]|uniref:PadR family transcriptional regulator n=1 Tax=Edaphobacter acidisoli TaxID=2040573 RepID=A0A916RRX2_9BACT|nr:PadR family transcriptional regulator [Edaphobacter acidisoli]GGA64793.1 PadR family transcriptional regulator [Edaphobacter acidisoli]
MPKKTLDPLPSAAFHILLALVDGDLHGYGVMRRVAEQTSGRVRLGPGTLYGSIQTLLEAGYIDEVETESSDRRRCYRLTVTGGKRVREETERLEELLRVARSKGVLEGGYV